MRADQSKFFLAILLSVIACLFVSCGKHTSEEMNPNGLVYSSTQDGPGTSSSLGALMVNIHSSTYNTNYEHYTIHIDGIGDYTVPINTIQFNEPDIKPGTYTFQLNLICENGNDDNCQQFFLKGKFTVDASYTTVVGAWL